MSKLKSATGEVLVLFVEALRRNTWKRIVQLDVPLDESDWDVEGVVRRW